LKSQVFEQAVIETPSGLNRLVDLLTSDESICDESVRNEVLLLLTGMVEKSEVVRKLVAFSEGFDRLFSIIEVRMDKKRSSAIKKLTQPPSASLLLVLRAARKWADRWIDRCARCPQAH
jgi:hypothetical protein